MKSLLVAVCLFGLSACTPEQIAAVEDAYRASIEAERGEAAPTWSVDADCNGAHVVLTGWSGVTDVSPSTGVAYAIFGKAGTNGMIPLDQDGNADVYSPVDMAAVNHPGWGWSLLINGADSPLLDVGGKANCT